MLCNAYDDMSSFNGRSGQNTRGVTLMTYTVAYIRSLIYNEASQATRFAVSAPAQEFHFSHNYICRM